MPKAATMPRRLSVSRSERHEATLGDQYAPGDQVKQKASKKRKQSDVSEEKAQDGYVDSKASKRILHLGRGLAAEEEEERNAKKSRTPDKSFMFESRFAQDDHDVASEDDMESGAFDDEGAWGSEEEVEEVKIDPRDLDTFNRFNPSFDPATLLQANGHIPDEQEQYPGTNLTDLILEKIAAHEAAGGEGNGQYQPPIIGGGEFDDAVELPAKVVEVYSQVGMLLSRYKSGKLPKPFKILPTLPQWDTLLSITRPDSWTPNAVYEATKLFSSSRPALAQAFNTDILLPRVRDDIQETKKLNVHLYKALKKALYKPAAFFRGLLFPLADSGTCTLREATIVGSLLARVSIPVLHSATALYRLCEISADQMMHDVESAGACNIFIRILLEKKYALPYRVVDALVFHFLRFRAVQQSSRNAYDVDMVESAPAFPGKNGVGDTRLPVLWHQCLLAFAQRYKDEITEDQREALLDLLLVRGHSKIGPEVRRELLEGRGRGVVQESGAMQDGDDTMLDA